MSAGKHTPAPWLIDPDNGDYPMWIRQDGGTSVLGGCGCCGSPNLDIHDARLIAAAPDLLDALQLMVESHGYSSYLSDEDKESSPEVVAARAAIAKATGSAK